MAGRSKLPSLTWDDQPTDPPELPTPPDRIGSWSAETEQWYQRWCEYPVACWFSDLEWDRIHRAAVLIEDYWHADLTHPQRVAISGEIRRLEADLGGTLLDRQRMGIEIGEGRQRSAVVVQLADPRSG